MYFIVGVDAGIKTGYAIVDLKGKMIATGTVKEANYDDIVRIISTFGTPSIIATDVFPSPFFVKKVAARFAAPLFQPKKSMLVKEKKKVGKGITDPHVRDAYAAAMKAYHHYANRLKQIDILHKSEDEKEKIKHLLMRGYAVGKL